MRSPREVTDTFPRRKDGLVPFDDLVRAGMLEALKPEPGCRHCELPYTQLIGGRAIQRGPLVCQVHAYERRRALEESDGQAE
jgi:hypothetical protein